MKKQIVTAVLLFMCGFGFAGSVGLPFERLALPEVSGRHLVCVWDDAAGTWLGTFDTYDHQGIYDFQVPEWGRWYWVGLWDSAKGEYVFGKWIGHFAS